jgi:hypothetical protein
VTAPTGNGPFGLAAGDFNKDGLPDLAVTDTFPNPTQTGISVLLLQYTETATATGVSAFGIGTHNVLASYPGDAAHAASQSATTALVGSTTFSITAPTTPATVAQGGSATVSIGVTPVGGAFNGVVTLSASGLPAGATAVFVAPTVTPGAGGRNKHADDSTRASQNGEAYGGPFWVRGGFI